MNLLSKRDCLVYAGEIVVANSLKIWTVPVGTVHISLKGVVCLEQTKKGWFSCLLTYAGAGKRRVIGSVILSVISVTAGLLPYYCVFRLIEAFSAGALREEGILTWCGLAVAARAKRYFSLSRKNA